MLTLYIFRDIIRKAVNASEHDAVIFTGSGCTGAVNKLIHALKFELPVVSMHKKWCIFFKLSLCMSDMAFENMWVFV